MEKIQDEMKWRREARKKRRAEARRGERRREEMGLQEGWKDERKRE